MRGFEVRAELVEGPCPAAAVGDGAVVVGCCDVDWHGSGGGSGSSVL